MNPAFKHDTPKKTGIVVLAHLLLMVVFLTALSPAAGCVQSNTVSKTALYLDTVVQITLYNGNEKLIDDCFNIIAEYEMLFSAKDTSSELYNLNQNGGGLVSDALYGCIAEALEYCQATDGAFDITIGALSDLWDFKKAEIPNDDGIRRAMDTIGAEYIKMGANKIEYLSEGTKIDLGGFAKGFISDRLCEYLTQNGVTSAIIALGGGIACIGSKPDGSSFSIGIQNPLADDGSLAKKLEIKGKSVSTSGNNERFFMANGKRYHHIIDPKTGYPAESGVASVTIISDTGAAADALSTACFILGVDASRELLKNFDDVSAVFILENGEQIIIPG